MKSQIVMGVVVTLSGIILCYIDFLINNEVKSSSLGFLGECLLWSGSVFGCKSYIDYQFKIKRNGTDC